MPGSFQHLPLREQQLLPERVILFSRFHQLPFHFLQLPLVLAHIGQAMLILFFLYQPQTLFLLNGFLLPDADTLNDNNTQGYGKQQNK